MPLCMYHIPRASNPNRAPWSDIHQSGIYRQLTTFIKASFIRSRAMALKNKLMKTHFFSRCFSANVKGDGSYTNYKCFGWKQPLKYFIMTDILDYFSQPHTVLSPKPYPNWAFDSKLFMYNHFNLLNQNPISQKPYNEEPRAYRVTFLSTFFHVRIGCF